MEQHGAALLPARSEKNRNTKKNTELTVSLCYPSRIELHWHKQTRLSPLSLPHSIDSVDNLDSPEKSLSSWPQTLCLSAHAYNIFLQPRGCFPPPFPLLLLPQFSSEFLSQHVWKKAGFVGRDWKLVPKSTPLLSSGRPAANWTQAWFVPLRRA